MQRDKLVFSITVPPNILDSLSTSGTVAVREHQNVTLTCKAEGFPTPSVKWKREDNKMILVDRRNQGKLALFSSALYNSSVDTVNAKLMVLFCKS